MDKAKMILAAKAVIWAGLAVILFSPLYVDGSVFFPYIVPKTLAFNISVEIMLLAFLALMWLTRKDEKKYELKANLPIILMGLYIVFSLVSSLFGDYFARSFWSNNERSEGIWLFLHLFVFLVIITSFLRKLKDWLISFDIFFVSSIFVSLIALSQYLSHKYAGFHDWINGVFAGSTADSYWRILISSSGGERLAGTLGNAGYMAGFLVFAIFLGIFLFFKRKHIAIRTYYALVVFLEIFIVFYTFSRGGILALFVVLFLFILYLLFFYFKDKRLRNLGIAVVLIGIAIPTVIFTNKDADWVKNDEILGRIAGISNIKSTTARNRLMTWESAYEGFKERPVLGWGQENFYQVFDKNFNPKIYRKEGSVIWFDRAHNIIFDRLLTGGIIGLLLYLSLLFAPLVFLWKTFAKKEGDNKRFFIPTAFSLALLAYFIQNQFIFEALVTYIPLFMIIGFVGLFGPHYEWKFLKKESFKVGALFVWIIMIIPLIYMFNVKPLQANLDITQILSNNQLSVEQRINLFKKVLLNDDRNNQEYRKQLYNFNDTVARSGQVDQDTVTELIMFTESELKKQIDENPHSATNYLLMMRLNNNLFRGTGQTFYVNRNFDIFEKLKELSPNRQQIYFEMGYTYFYLGDYYKNTNQDDLAAQHRDMAIDSFHHALELNPENIDSFRQLVRALIIADRSEDIPAIVDEFSALIRKLADEKQIMDESLPAKAEKNFYYQVINTALPMKRYAVINMAAVKLVELEPENPANYSQLALSLAYLGKDAEAIEVAEEVAKLGGDFAKQSEQFIADVKAGKFK